jgi:hypothetical protein
MGSLDQEPKRAGTRPYVKFVSELQIALLAPNKSEAAHLLDGLAGQRCLDLVRPKTVRRLGAFFTPSRVAEKVVNLLSVSDWADARVFDPTCGAADLLLPIARRLPLKRTISSTLEFWNNRISGCDLSPEFIEAARLRLILLAVTRGLKLDDSPTNLAKLLNNICVGDGLASEVYSKSSYIVMNPPYGRVDSGNQQWREGSVTSAALFVDRAAQLSAPGTQIAALLPEVLRTGSSYKTWRSHIEQLVMVNKAQSIGLFSDHADVDVFAQHFVKEKNRTIEASVPHKSTGITIGDHFSVSVGAVVPYRDRMIGPRLAYLHPKNATPWNEMSRINETRKFKGRTFAPPFIAVRRTSRPGDRHRATPTLVLGKRKVAVENHLIVLTPKRGGITICRKAIALMRSPMANTFLNRIMRCRHLTTASVSLLPWA